MSSEPPSAPLTGRSIVVDDEHSGDVDADRLVALAAAVLDAEGVPADLEVGILLVEPARIAELKALHLDGDGSPTDVLAFPIDDPGSTAAAAEPAEGSAGGLLGDVVLCPAVAAEQASAHAGSRPGHDGTPERELDLLLVHGLLHLLGHDHAEPDPEAAMRAREVELLAGWWARR